MNDDRPSGASSGGRTPRTWLGIHFECCDVYSRIYRSRVREAYEGRCPKCGAPVSVAVGPDGTGERFFRAG